MTEKTNHFEEATNLYGYFKGLEEVGKMLHAPDANSWRAGREKAKEIYAKARGAVPDDVPTELLNGELVTQLDAAQNVAREYTSANLEDIVESLPENVLGNERSLDVLPYFLGDKGGIEPAKTGNETHDRTVKDHNDYLKSVETLSRFDQGKANHGELGELRKKYIKQEEKAEEDQAKEYTKEWKDGKKASSHVKLAKSIARERAAYESSKEGYIHNHLMQNVVSAREKLESNFNDNYSIVDYQKGNVRAALKKDPLKKLEAIAYLPQLKFEKKAA